jgi:anti-sigma B factor antagonist
MSAAGSTPVTVRAVQHDGAVVLHVAGEIDLASSPSLTASIVEGLRQRPAALIVDLTEVLFLGSSGISALIGAQDLAGDQTNVRVVASSPVTLRPLEVTGLLTAISIYPSVEAALAEPLGRSVG